MEKFIKYLGMGLSAFSVTIMPLTKDGVTIWEVIAALAAGFMAMAGLHFDKPGSKTEKDVD